MGMASTRFAHDVRTNGIRLELLERRVLRGDRVVPPADWSRARPLAMAAIARVLSAAEAEDGSAVPDGGGIRLAHRLVADLSEAQAAALGLPPAVPLTLRLSPRGRIDQAGFAIRADWTEAGDRPVRATRTGSVLDVTGARYRIPGPLFTVLEAVDRLGAADPADEAARFEALASLHGVLPEAKEHFVQVDGYLRTVRVVHAAAFSLDLRTDGGGFDFDPVLFGRRVADRVGSGDGAEVSEAEGLLSGHEQAVFAGKRFRAYAEARDRYPIEHGTYVFVDPALRGALGVVREMQQAPLAERRAFARQPQRVLKERLGRGDAAAAEAIERLFIETVQYSERVIGVGAWAPPVIPWLKTLPNEWLPERFGLKVGDAFVELTPADIPALRERCTRALAQGEPTFEHRGTTFPASEELRAAVETLTGCLAPGPEAEAQGNPDASQATRSAPQVLLVEEHHERVTYRRKPKPRPADARPSRPAALATDLKPHQEAGLEWLQRAWLGGAGGVLLADDMGLGKTIQALAFLAWLKQLRGRAPTLVVAPTGLLVNWEEEHGKHLLAPGLGRLCKAYGPDLGRLRQGRGTDIERGAAGLSSTEIARADWVLTTYETLRDYHHSFAAIPFAAVVFDEMQKLKNPAALVTRGAQTSNADFVLGLTGTPVENRLEDLWSIFDIVEPGRLGDLKTFSQTYRPDDRPSLERLRAELLDPQGERPPAILRRFKSKALPGLPLKHEHPLPVSMPRVQAEVYQQIVERAKSGERGSMLETLHALRGVSLHPVWPSFGAMQDPGTYVEQSARLAQTVRLLDGIKKDREKALVFVESLEMQDLLAELFQKLYGLKRRPLQIKGDIAGPSRQKAVHAFQAEPGFDVMLLTPKAGGVGLTLTAANHVIHLSRWWNPAVEDQSTDRVYRIGQDKDVHVYYPMAVHPLYAGASFDEILHRLLERKRALARELLVPPVDPDRDGRELFDAVLGGQLDPSDDPSFLLADIDRMDPTDFERWALRRMQEAGYVADATPRSHDGGADGVMVHRVTGARVLTQCKHRQDPASFCCDEGVDDLLRARTRYTADGATLAVLSNARAFTPKAEARARAHGIRLVAREWLPAWPRGCL